MGFDARLKRLFPFVLCGLIALVAYFQASAVGDLVGSVLGETAPAPRSKTVAPAGAPDEKRSGQPILDRNPFDSQTGSLTGADEEEPEEEGDEEPAPALGDVPPCTFGRVVVITTNSDPAWSFAFIEDAGGKRTLRHVGDAVDGHTLEALAWDRVYLLQGDRRCQMRLGEKIAKGSSKPKPAEEERPARGRNDRLPDELAAKIRKVSETEFEVERSVVDEILEQQTQLMRRTRMKPVKEGDKVVGLEVSRVRPGTLLDVLGLEDGDQMQSINGFDLSNPQKALEAYGRLRQADSLSLKIVRGGAPVTIEYRIR
jgi:general secretion pathway protein C